MFQEVNIEREARGLTPFVLLPELAELARTHSRKMLKAGFVSHEADGSRFEERVDKVVPGACRFGENITKHYAIAYALVDLMGSRGHRSNLLDPDFTGIGIGIARSEDGLLYITQNFVGFCKEKRKQERKRERQLRYSLHF